MQDALEEHVARRTPRCGMVTVAHRLSTVWKAEAIIVLHRARDVMGVGHPCSLRHVRGRPLSVRACSSEAGVPHAIAAAQGRVHEVGTHEELLQKEGGLYRSLVAHQLAATRLEANSAGAGASGSGANLEPSPSSAALFDEEALVSPGGVARGGSGVPLLLVAPGGDAAAAPIVGRTEAGVAAPSQGGGGGAAAPATPAAPPPLISLL